MRFLRRLALAALIVAVAATGGVRAEDTVEDVHRQCGAEYADPFALAKCLKAEEKDYGKKLAETYRKVVELQTPDSKKAAHRGTARVADVPGEELQVSPQRSIVRRCRKRGCRGGVVHAAHDHAAPRRIRGVAAKSGALKGDSSGGPRSSAGSDLATALRLDLALRLLGQLATLGFFLFLQCRQGVDLRPLQRALGDRRKYAAEVLAYVFCRCFHVGQL